MKNLYTLIILGFLTCKSTNAQIVQSFAILKQITQRGDITFAANTITTCSANVGAADCAVAKTANPPGSGTPYPTGTIVANNGNLNNNNFTGATNMSYVDADGTPAFGGITTFSSSRAFLDLSNNPGCSVIEAYLIWGAYVVPASTPNYAKRDSIYMKAPGVANYKGFKADFLTDNTAGATTYQCYKNITNDIRSGGEGDYWVGNVIAQTGSATTSSNWAIVVIYGDETLPLRNLTIYKGYANISTGAGAQTVNISGFYTPPGSANVNIKLGLFSLEGDQGTLGDSLKFNNIPIYDALNRQDNIFNSSVTIGGVSVNGSTATHPGNPTFVNTLGYDADIITINNTAKNYLTNGATSATIKLTTGGDQYWPFLLTTAIDVYEPNVFATKDWVDDNGGLVELGDIVTYNIKVNNKGTDPATNVEVVDSLIGAMNYIAGSCRILTGPNVGVKTDAIGDDQVDVNGNVIKFRIGGGANGTTGGTVGITAATDSVTTFTFKVKISTDCQMFHCSGDVKNLAYINYRGFTSGQNRTTLSSANGLDAFGCPIQGPTGFTVIVPACTPIPDTTLSVFCEPYALSTIAPFRPGFTSYFNSSWGTVTNATTNGTYYATKELFPGCSDTIAIFFSSGGNCLLLPVHLKSITANYLNNNGIVHWTTTAETNTFKFIVQRSTNGVDFLTIGDVLANGNTSIETNYSFTDAATPIAKKVYYRIKIIDRDGTEKISKIVFVYANKAMLEAEIVQVVPNPIVNEAIIKVLCKNKGIYNYQIINNLGQVITSTKVNLVEGNNDIHISRQALSKGIYVVKLNTIDYNGAVTKTIVIN
jgi:uncharacterized repeat protein (TIGR01451 family)